MKPLYFGEEPRQLYGVYHAAVRRPGRESGVLLCAPVGQESIRAHRTLRKLATMLAEAGFHALRFDYFGHGDSSGESADGSVSGWVADVRAAADELKDLAGVHRVSLVGLRYGATLAALAAAGRRDLDTLALVDPVVDGGAYLEELRTMHIAFMRADLRGHDFGREWAETAGTREALGWPLPAPLRREIETTEVLAANFAARKVVLVSSRERDGGLGRLLARAAALAPRTAFEHVPGADGWNQEAVCVPMPALQAILAALA